MTERDNAKRPSDPGGSALRRIIALDHLGATLGKPTPVVLLLTPTPHPSDIRHEPFR